MLRSTQHEWSANAAFHTTRVERKRCVPHNTSGAQMLRSTQHEWSANAAFHTRCMGQHMQWDGLQMSSIIIHLLCIFVFRI